MEDGGDPDDDADDEVDVVGLHAEAEALLQESAVATAPRALARARQRQPSRTEHVTIMCSNVSQDTRHSLLPVGRES